MPFTPRCRAKFCRNRQKPWPDKRRQNCTQKSCALDRAASRAGGAQRLVSLSHCARAAADRRCATVLTTSQFTIGRDSEAGGGEAGSGAYIES